MFFYGLQDVSLEEVFLKVTEQFKTSPTAANVKDEITSEHPSPTTGKLAPIERRVTGVRLYAKQALTITIKRLSFNYRNMRRLITQILSSASLTAPGFAEPPPIVLSTAMSKITFPEVIEQIPRMDFFIN